MTVNTQQLMMWGALIQQAAAMGAKSWTVIHALAKDAGADDATIAALKPKWDVLVDDVRRAARGE